MVYNNQLSSQNLPGYLWHIPTCSDIKINLWFPEVMAAALWALVLALCTPCVLSSLEKKCQISWAYYLMCLRTNDRYFFLTVVKFCVSASTLITYYIFWVGVLQNVFFVVVVVVVVAMHVVTLVAWALGVSPNGFSLWVCGVWAQDMSPCFINSKSLLHNVYLPLHLYVLTQSGIKLQ